MHIILTGVLWFTNFVVKSDLKMKILAVIYPRLGSFCTKKSDITNYFLTEYKF